VLGDYFDYIGGTSTGAIIATCLSLGAVKKVQTFYEHGGAEMFDRCTPQELMPRAVPSGNHGVDRQGVSEPRPGVLVHTMASLGCSMSGLVWNSGFQRGMRCGYRKVDMTADRNASRASRLERFPVVRRPAHQKPNQQEREERRHGGAPTGRSRG